MRSTSMRFSRYLDSAIATCRCWRTGMPHSTGCGGTSSSTRRWLLARPRRPRRAAPGSSMPRNWVSRQADLAANGARFPALGTRQLLKRFPRPRPSSLVAIPALHRLDPVARRIDAARQLHALLLDETRQQRIERAHDLGIAVD